MEIVTIVFRTILIYFVVFFMLRIMGKREIGKLSLFDFVISIMIAEIAVFVLEDMNRPIMGGLLPMVVLVSIQIGIAYLSLKNQKARSWFGGDASLIIHNGKIDREEMKKQRYNLDDLIGQLRQNKILNVSDVEFAILENTGKLTVIEKKPDEAPRAPDKIRYEGLPVPLIMDGKVQDHNLEKIGKTRFWLKNELREQGVADFKEVFFCSIDHRGRLFLDRKR